MKTGVIKGVMRAMSRAAFFRGLAFLLVAAVAFYAAGQYVAALGPRRAAEGYLTALALGEAGRALEGSVGNAAYAASRLEEEAVKARDVRVGTAVTAKGREWAEVEATAEMTLGDGSADVSWYVLEAVKANGNWKVADVQPVPPRLSGVGLPAQGEDVDAAKGVFVEYLRLLSQGSYAEAAKLTVGPARAAQERQAEMLGKAPLFEEVSEVSARPLWRRDEYLKLLAEYEIDCRPVTVTVLMCRTGQGWRVAGVSRV